MTARFFGDIAASFTDRKDPDRQRTPRRDSYAVDDQRSQVFQPIRDGWDWIGAIVQVADVPAPRLDGQSVQLIRYHRVIACYAKAELIERHRDFDTTGAGFDKADELAPSMDESRRDAMHTIRDMLGRTRTRVESI